MADSGCVGRVRPAPNGGGTLSSPRHDYSAHESDELAALYDAVYADSDDIAFWLAVTPAVTEGPVLELGCGTGRVLLPLARAGHEVVGIDLAPHMLARARTKLEAEPGAVRDRVTIRLADMTAFDLGRRFAQVYCAFGTFHYLDTVEKQLSCLERCREHLLPGGTLVLDLINPDPAPVSPGDEDPAPGSGLESGLVAVTDGRCIRSWVTVIDCDRSQQCNHCEVRYETIGPDGTTRQLAETFPCRFVFRYELEHLLARCGFRIVTLYGDYDRSAYSEKSLGMIVVAEASEG